MQSIVGAIQGCQFYDALNNSYTQTGNCTFQSQMNNGLDHSADIFTLSVYQVSNEQPMGGL
jgi:hypothetical protein